VPVVPAVGARRALVGVLPRLGPGTQVMSWISLSAELAR
jgi:hypothetical protein